MRIVRENGVRCVTVPAPSPGSHVDDLDKIVKLDLSALVHNDLAIPQEWGLAIQQHPANFQGIKFKSRFNDKVCLALFQRDGIETRLKGNLIDKLPNNDTAVDWLDKHKINLY